MELLTNLLDLKPIPQMVTALAPFAYGEPELTFVLRGEEVVSYNAVNDEFEVYGLIELTDDAEGRVTLRLTDKRGDTLMDCTVPTNE